MPFIKITTNQEISPEQQKAMFQDLTQLMVEELAKPKEYVQVQLASQGKIMFAGSEEPNAFVELRSLGFPEEKAKAVSKGICGLLEKNLNVPPERVFINFFDISRAMWGWKGSTFG